jgi:hypothetical protein
VTRKTCNSCGAISSSKPGARFCTKCGNVLRASWSRSVLRITGIGLKVLGKVLLAIVAVLIMLLEGIFGSRDSESVERYRPRREPLMCPKCGWRMRTFGNRSVCESCAKELFHPWRIRVA